MVRSLDIVVLVLAVGLPEEALALAGLAYAEAYHALVEAAHYGDCRWLGLAYRRIH